MTVQSQQSKLKSGLHCERNPHFITFRFVRTESNVELGQRTEHLNKNR